MRTAGPEPATFWPKAKTRLVSEANGIISSVDPILGEVDR